MSIPTKHSRCVWALACALVACGSDPTRSEGMGNAKFTTWGEEYIEQEIPEGDDGFIDGWTVRYDKFLVNFHQITIGHNNTEEAARSDVSYFVDLARPGRKTLVEFKDLEAKAWDEVSYQIKPAHKDAKIVAGEDADLEMMVEEGYSVYVAGSASKDDVTKTFKWGFSTATQYSNCQHEAEGKTTVGVVIKNDSTDTSELTIHGDHFFYDRLQASPDPEVTTALRFQEKADADADEDGEITLDELFDVGIDVRTYDPSGLKAPTLGAFITALSRTIGHFRGEGECSVSAL